MNSKQLLKQKRIRVTPQRLAIFEAVLFNNRHPSAETVYETVKRKYPSISLNTVYKTLQRFTECGLLWQLNVSRHTRYDANTVPHAHACCPECEKIEDLGGNLEGLFTALMDLANAHSSYLINSLQINFFGCCPQCSSNNTACFI